MADSTISITAGTGTQVDTRTEATNGHHRQVVVLGDPAINAGVAPVDATAGLKVDLGADNDITGTVTANLSATDNAVLDSIDAAVNGTLTVGSHAVTNAGTFATQVTSLPSSTNTIEVVGDAAENAAAAGNPVLTGGRYDLTPRTLGDGDVGAIALDPDGAVQISDGGNSITVDGSLTVDLGANNDVTVTNATAANLKVDGSDVTQPISAASLPLPSGASTAAKQPALGTAGTASADVLTVQGITSMTPLKVDGSSVTQPVSGTVAVTNSDITSIKTAVETIDNAISGSEMQVDVVAALPAGTNTIGSVKSVPSDIDINGSNANHADKYYTNAGAVTDGIIWSPAAGKRWHVLNLTINVSAACTVTIEDDLAAGDNPRLKFEFAANSGITIPYNKEHPFSSGEDAADLLITTTAGNVYVQALGYEV